MEENQTKRRGKFNIIDIIAVVLIVLILFFVGYKLMNRGSVVEQVPMTKVTYWVKAEGVPAELYENCKAHLPSPLMASGKLVGGEIQEVEQEPFYVMTEDGDWVEDTKHTTLIFKAVTETPTGEVVTTKVGEQEVRVGKTDYILKSEFIELSDVTIIDVTWEAPEKP